MMPDMRIKAPSEAIELEKLKPLCFSRPTR